eukprot:7377047-Prymnesium_polylepis.1
MPPCRVHTSHAEIQSAPGACALWLGAVRHGVRFGVWSSVREMADCFCSFYFLLLRLTISKAWSSRR